MKTCVASVLALVLASACGRSVDPAIDAFVPGPDLATSCPDDLPGACPAPAPSWQIEVAPVISSLCAGCHKPGGRAATKPLLTYDEVFQRRSAVLNQIYSCYMPPEDSTVPTPAQRQLLLAWLVCGAPNN